MDLETIKNLIKQYSSGHAKYVRKCMETERYYLNDNDILYTHKKSSEGQPQRNADNRIPRNFHGLLVNQKTAYMFTAPPLFDVGKKSANTIISDTLGDDYAKACKELCVNASNCKVGWLHYWIDDVDRFQYGVVDSKQIIPVFSNGLKKKLVAVMRKYTDMDESDGREITVWEYWTDRECSVFKSKKGTYATGLQEYNQYISAETEADGGNVYQHDFGEVPFIPFFNRSDDAKMNQDDLAPVKKLIDAYDGVYSGFLNDLEDTQEIIYVLTNYGGTDLKEFLKDLKEYKAIKVDDDGTGKSGVETLTISIPIEAREKFLEITRKSIFEQGQGVDPDPEKYGNASGVALKYLYSQLELKAGFMETEFRCAFGRLVKAICKYHNIQYKRLIQTWTRTAVTNDAELADICSKSTGVVSNKTILKSHPLVEDADREEQQLEEEAQKVAEKEDMYREAFRVKQKGQEDEPDGEEKQEE